MQLSCVVYIIYTNTLHKNLIYILSTFISLHIYIYNINPIDSLLSQFLGPI